MLKLCGFASSNYYNKVKLALLEKELPFEEELVWSTGDAAFLAKTPLGKIPYLETDAGVITESGPINEYLESTFASVPLLPSDPFAAAHVRELIQFVELYLEWEARRLYSEAFFGGQVSGEIKASVHRRLTKGLAALPHFTRFEDFAFGKSFGLADCALIVHLPVIGFATKLIYGSDMVTTPAIKDYLGRMAERPSVMRMQADRKANVALMAERNRKAT